MLILDTRQTRRRERQRSQVTIFNQVHNLQQTIVALLLLASPALLMAQTNPTQAERWLLKADLAPPLIVPTSIQKWERERKDIRTNLWRLLGKLPPRPRTPKVE